MSMQDVARFFGKVAGDDGRVPAASVTHTNTTREDHHVGEGRHGRPGRARAHG